LIPHSNIRAQADIRPVCAHSNTLFFILRLLRNKAAERRVELLLAFTLATLIIGLFVLLAGILPFLQIGTISD
jgi:ABC-type multidrug transport system permease subunit